MTNVNYGQTKYLEKLKELYPLNSIDWFVLDYLTRDGNSEIIDNEEYGKDKDFGYVVILTDKNGTRFGGTFSDYLISLDNTCDLVLDFTWINMVYSHLNLKAKEDAKNYLEGASLIIDAIEKDRNTIENKKMVEKMRQTLETISHCKYSKLNQKIKKSDISYYTLRK